MSDHHFGNLCSAHLIQVYMLSQLFKSREIRLSKCQALMLSKKQNLFNFFSVLENILLSNDKSQFAPLMTWLG